MGVVTDLIEEHEQKKAKAESNPEKIVKSENLSFKYFPVISEVIDRFVKEYLFDAQYQAYYKVDVEKKIISILVHQPATNRRDLAHFSFNDFEEITSIAGMNTNEFRDKIAYEFIPDDRDLEVIIKDEKLTKF